MKFILDMIERLKLTDEDKENGNPTFEDVFDDIIRSIKQRLSFSDQTTASTRNSRKEALYRLYSSGHSSKRGPLSNRRRHSIEGFECSGTQAANVSDLTQKRQEAFDFDIVKDKVLPQAGRSKESLAESVARKIEARKKAVKKLTRSQTVAVIRTKYNLNQISG